MMSMSYPDTTRPTSVWPLVIPHGWIQCPEQDGLKMLWRDMPNGLRATFAIEHYPGPGADNLGPCEQTGTFRRVVLSRKKSYPTWDEMRDFIRSCGLFDRTRDVMMVIPPDEEYVNMHPNAFHWWQKVEA
jgi:hypothetical protein